MRLPVIVRVLDTRRPSMFLGKDRLQLATACNICHDVMKVGLVACA